MEQFSPQNQGYYNPYPPIDPIRQAERKERRTLSRLGFALFIYLIFVSLLQTALSWGCSTFFPEVHRQEWFQWILQTAPAYLLGVPLVACLLIGMPKEKPQKKKLGLSGWTGFLAISFFLVLLGGLISNLLIARIEELKGGAVSDLVSQQISEFSPLMTFGVIVIAAPIFEELLFRKILVDRLLPYSEAFAILTGGLIFGLVHGNFYQFFYAAMLGMFFSFIYIRTGRIRHTILMHMIINFTGSIVAPFLMDITNNLKEPTGSVDLWQMLGGVYSTANYILAFCGLVLLILSINKLKTATQGARGLTLGQQIKVGWLNAGMLLTGSFCLINFITSIII